MFYYLLTLTNRFGAVALLSELGWLVTSWESKPTYSTLIYTVCQKYSSQDNCNTVKSFLILTTYFWIVFSKHSFSNTVTLFMDLYPIHNPNNITIRSTGTILHYKGRKTVAERFRIWRCMCWCMVGRCMQHDMQCTWKQHKQSWISYFAKENTSKYLALTSFLALPQRWCRRRNCRHWGRSELQL